LRLAATAPAVRPAAKPLPNPQKEKTDMDKTKTPMASRTLWANVVGLAALGASWLGYSAHGVDQAGVAEALAQGVAALSFIASSVFRIDATRRIGG
jgi:hypothetical protein